MRRAEGVPNGEGGAIRALQPPCCYVSEACLGEGRVRPKSPRQQHAAESVGVHRVGGEPLRSRPIGNSVLLGKGMLRRQEAAAEAPCQRPLHKGPIEWVVIVAERGQEEAVEGSRYFSHCVLLSGLGVLRGREATVAAPLATACC